MLVLQREINEEIVIGTNPLVIVTVVGIKGGRKVQIGIDAPPNIEVHRREIWEEIHPPVDKR